MQPLPIDDADPRGVAWRLFIETSARLTTALDEQLRRDAHLTLADFHVMLLLSEAPDGRLRMKEVAERMVFSPSRLTYQVDQLCKRGWLCRERAAEDRRGSYAVLTDDGHEVFATAARDHAALVHRLFHDALSPADGGELATLMRRLADHLDRQDPR
ncbi:MULTISPECIES: MarR family winged helix-turn-helix transcriptional regulator [unclassified Gordonia (in: high G+C Gram-positive bacteria)]|uniref:MarR family winged helix-turn-helix transcriptional regulator n=1 Tax=unclassified Gordonia (in: high G+C Gram-positive bacteria) TaxID=2657482 RepID=UPI001FFE5FA3|nr:MULTISPECIES: MarR family transcriptional regulator [unclassified Gordonia (in: high G+C Gram-positive bacteria)]UQE76006.1 MarR family transcriptional regulator [Gordonia sp. PP30]